MDGGTEILHGRAAMSRIPPLALMRRLIATKTECEQLWALLHSSRPIIPCDVLNRYVRALRRAETLQSTIRQFQP